MDTLKTSEEGGGFLYYPTPGSAFPKGVVAIDGYEIKHITFATPLPWANGVDFAVKLLIIYILI
jgi:hypothetical protein